MNKDENIKIVRITHSNLGGAGLCVQRLHESYNSLYGNETLLIANGVRYDDSILIAEQDEKDNYHQKRSYIGTKIYHLLLRLKLIPQEIFFREELERIRRTRSFFFTLPFSNYKDIIKLSSIDKTDIINLHWVGDFVDIPSFVKDIGKPLVWSLHDENPARGGLHYDCPYPEYRRLDRELQKVKIKALKNVQNLNVVVQSKKMEEFCLNSKVLGKYPVTVIPNGVNVNQFVCKDKTESRKELDLPLNSKVFLFSSVDIYDKRKGLAYLISALEQLNDENVILLCIGRYDKVPQTKIKVRCLGYIDDHNKHSSIISSSDYFVLSSFQESFAKTPLEAMACGIPVIAFPCSGVEDCITKDTGVICSDFTIESLNKGIREALAHKYDRDEIRNHVKKNFTFEIMAKKYRALYESILRK